ncbi:MAG: DUF4010 domain-containing protein [Bryobacteraceae bacterium]|nr:DUF4010 domain-containing protein [Bryobacteraceae bacterium]
MDASQFAGIAIAALGGAAVGVERQRSGHASGPKAHLGGLRTFTLLGLIAGTAGWMWTNEFRALAVVLMAAAAALIVAGYFAASRTDVDGTTETAGIVVLMAGALAGAGQLWLGGGLIAITALILSEKTVLHEMAGRLDDLGLRAGFRFAVMAIVILPLLPEGPYGGLGGVRPRQLWMLVLFFTGLNFLGYIARLLAGAHNGYVVTGMLGGLVSSTNVTWTFSRLSQVETGIGGPLALGAIAASSIMYVRMILATSVIHTDVGMALAPFLAAPFLISCAVLAVGLRRRGQAEVDLAAPANPLNLKSALQLSVLFQLVIFGIHLAGRFGGDQGTLASAAVLGLTDVDALVVSFSQNARTTMPVATAALAISVGALSNTLMKLGLVVFLGRARFRWLAGIGLAAMAGAAVLSIAMLSPRVT